MSTEIFKKQKFYTLFLLVLVFTSSHIDRNIIAILLQPIKETFLVSDTQLGFLTVLLSHYFTPLWQSQWRCGPIDTIEETS